MIDIFCQDLARTETVKSFQKHAKLTKHCERDEIPLVTRWPHLPSKQQKSKSPLLFWLIDWQTDRQSKDGHIKPDVNKYINKTAVSGSSAVSYLVKVHHVSVYVVLRIDVLNGWPLLVKVFCLSICSGCENSPLVFHKSIPCHWQLWPKGKFTVMLLPWETVALWKE